MSVTVALLPPRNLKTTSVKETLRGQRIGANLSTLVRTFNCILTACSCQLKVNDLFNHPHLLVVSLGIDHWIYHIPPSFRHESQPFPSRLHCLQEFLEAQFSQASTSGIQTMPWPTTKYQRLWLKFCTSWECRNLVHACTLLETNSSPLKKGRTPKGN